MSVNSEIYKVTPAVLILNTELVSCHTPDASSFEMAIRVLENLWTVARHCNRFHIVR
jgi:hypothetical protein